MGKIDNEELKRNLYDPLKEVISQYADSDTRQGDALMLAAIYCVRKLIMKGNKPEEVVEILKGHAQDQHDYKKNQEH